MAQKINPQGDVEDEHNGGRIKVFSSVIDNAKIDPQGYLYKEEIVGGVTGRIPVVNIGSFGLNSVTSVNGKSGDVVLSANDVGAATSQFVTTSIEDIQIGGRNYVRNSNFSSGLSKWNNWGTCDREVVNINGYSFVRLSSSITGVYRGLQQAILFKPNQSYTISFLAKNAGVGGNVRILLQQTGDGNNDPQIGWGTLIDSTLKKYSFNFVSVNNPNKTVFNFMIGERDGIPFDIYITNIQFELGNKATDWRPAIEDIPIPNGTTPLINSSNKIDNTYLPIEKVSLQLTPYGATTAGVVGSYDIRMGKCTIINNTAFVTCYLRGIFSAKPVGQVRISGLYKSQLNGDLSSTSAAIGRRLVNAQFSFATTQNSTNLTLISNANGADRSATWGIDISDEMFDISFNLTYNV